MNRQLASKDRSYNANHVGAKLEEQIAVPRGIAGTRTPAVTSVGSFMERNPAASLHANNALIRLRNYQLDTFLVSPANSVSPLFDLAPSPPF